MRRNVLGMVEHLWFAGVYPAVAAFKIRGGPLHHNHLMRRNAKNKRA
jgi:hypothetical protein